MPPVEAAYMDCGPTWDKPAEPEDHRLERRHRPRRRNGDDDRHAHHRHRRRVARRHVGAGIRRLGKRHHFKGDDLPACGLCAGQGHVSSGTARSGPTGNRWAPRRWRSWRRTSPTSSSPTAPGPPRSGTTGPATTCRRTTSRCSTNFKIRRDPRHPVDVTLRTTGTRPSAWPPDANCRSAVSVEGGARIHGSGA